MPIKKAIGIRSRLLKRDSFGCSNIMVQHGLSPDNISVFIPTTTFKNLHKPFYNEASIS